MFDGPSPFEQVGVMAADCHDAGNRDNLSAMGHVAERDYSPFKQLLGF